MAQHEATFELEGAKSKTVRIALPANVVRGDVRDVRVEDAAAIWQFVVEEDTPYLIVKLPADRKYPRLTMRWTELGKSLGVVGSIALPLPKPEGITFWGGRWAVWLPPGYESLNTSGTTSLTWTRRLFGPFGREEDVGSFNPLSLADWQTLWDYWQGRLPLGRDAAHGWKVSHVEIMATTPPLRFVHRSSMQLFAITLFLIVVALGCWKLIHRPAAFGALLGFFVVAALVLPAVYAPLASGGVLGLLFVLVWQRMHPKIEPIKASMPSSSATHPAVRANVGSTVTKIVGLGILLVVMMAAVAWGETPREGTRDKTDNPAPIHRVIVPIDAQKKPVGDKVFVPELFYKQLHLHATTPAEKPKGWLILRAAYRGNMTSEEGRLGIETLRAVYDIEVLERATRVRIPLRAEGIHLLPKGVLLDGRPIEPEWAPDATALTFEIAEPGEYHVEIAIRPTVRNVNELERNNVYDVADSPYRWFGPYAGDGTVGFEIAIPRVARSTLELTLPDDAPAIETPSACGTVVRDRNPPRLFADLGPTGRLVVRWRENTPSGSTGPAIDMEQLFWMKLQPGSLVVTAKFHLHVLEGQVQQVQLAVDPRLRLLPLTGDNAPTVQAGQETGQSRLLVFRWPRPIGEESTLEATFLLSGATGVGNFRIPRIEMLDARAVKRWMAVSVDPSLDHEEQARDRLETASIARFLRVWNEGERRPAKSRPDGSHKEPATPLVAYRLPAGEVDWTISTRPHEPRTTADQTLVLSCDQDHIDARFEAHITTASGYLFQYRITGPAAWQIQDVSLMEGNVERANRWSQDADGAITIFLNNAASSEQKLVVRGRLAIEEGQAWSLPAVSLERCELRSRKTLLFRRPSVLLTVHGGNPWTQPPSSIDKKGGFVPRENPIGEANDPKLGRFVAAFNGDAPASNPVTVRVKSNRPINASVVPVTPSEPKNKARDAATPTTTPANGVVRLADITVLCGSDGNCRTKAAFDVEPRGARECLLKLPDGHEVLQVSVERMTVLPKAMNDGLLVPLTSQSLPQRIEVLMTGVAPEADSSGRFVFGTVGVNHWTVRQTLWTIVAPSTWNVVESEDAIPVSDWKQELARLKSVVATTESADDASSRFSESPRWFPAWNQRVIVSCKALRRALAAAGGGKDVIDAQQQLETVEKRMAKLADRIGVKKETESDVADFDSTFLPIADGYRTVVRYAFDGTTDSLGIDCRMSERPSAAGRRLAALAVLCLTVLIVWGIVRGVFERKTIPWPHAIGVLLGLAWWIWLAPSVLGLCIAAANIVAMGWRRQAKRVGNG
jgi:hypothetical protein